MANKNEEPCIVECSQLRDEEFEDTFVSNMACNLERLSYEEALILLNLKTIEEEYPMGYDENDTALFNLYVKKNMLRYFVRRGEFQDCKCCDYWKEFLKFLPISVREKQFCPVTCTFYLKRF